MDDCTMQSCLFALLIILLLMHFRKSQGHQGLIEGWTQHHKDNLFLLLSDSSGNIERYAMKDLINKIDTKHSDAKAYADSRARWFSDDRLNKANTYTNSEINKAKTYADGRARWFSDDRYNNAIKHAANIYIKRGKAVRISMKRNHEGNPNHIEDIGGGGHNQLKYADNDSGKRTFYINEE